MAEIHSNTLGWTNGQNVEPVLQAALNALSVGDVFVFDEFYELTGPTITIPDGIILAGGQQGAGLDITDTATVGGVSFNMGANNQILDLTVTFSNAPDIPIDTLEPKAPKYLHAKTLFHTKGNDGLRIANCSFRGNIQYHVSVDSDNFTIEDTHLRGGLVQVRVLPCDGFVYRNNFCDKAIDGIKTIKGSTSARVQNSLCENFFCYLPTRDFLDTTGGFSESIVRDGTIVGGFAAIDVKTIIKDPADIVGNEPKNENLDIIRVHFVNSAAALTVTTLERSEPLQIDENNFPDWAVQNIHMIDCILEKTGLGTPNKKGIFYKHAHTVTWTNLELRGDSNLKVQKRSDTDENLPASYGVTGTHFNGAAPRANPVDYSANIAAVGPDWNNITYPTTGSPPPLISSTPTASVEENTTGTLFTFEANNTTNFSISGGDSALFSVSTGGALTSNAVLDFEAPTDANSDNVYEFVLTATGPDGTDVQNFALTIEDDDMEGANLPLFTSSDEITLLDGTVGSFHTVEATATTEFALDGIDQSYFSIDGDTGELFVLVPLDFETPSDGNSDNIYSVDVTATGPGGSAVQSILITVTDDVSDNALSIIPAKIGRWFARIEAA